VEKLLSRLKDRQKTLVVILIDLLSSWFTFIFAYFLRFGASLPEGSFEKDLVIKLLVVGFTQVTSFYLMDHYRGIWRFSSTHDLVRILKDVTLAVPISFGALFLLKKFTAYLGPFLLIKLI